MDWIRATFSPRPEAAGAAYGRFVAEGIGQDSPWAELVGQVFLGSASFVREVATKGEAASPGEVPRLQRRPAPPSLPDLAGAHPRDETIAQAYASGGYTLREIGDYFGLHYSHVSRIARRGRTKYKT